MSNSLNTLIQVLVPKDKVFFTLFGQASANMVQCASTLRDAVHADSVTRLQVHRRIEQLERDGDDIIHLILKRSSTSFLTPFDREDIQELARTLDDVTDYLYAISKRIELYKIHQFDAAFLQMMEHVLAGCRSLDRMVRDLPQMTLTPQMSASLHAIRECEKAVDVLCDDAIAHLFAAKGNAVEILKQKEILSLLATAADRAEQTASVIEAVLLKFS